MYEVKENKFYTEDELDNLKNYPKDRNILV